MASVPKTECIHPGTLLSLEEARRLVSRYVEHFNTLRLHNAGGYITPKAKLAEREKIIRAERDVRKRRIKGIFG